MATAAEVIDTGYRAVGDQKAASDAMLLASAQAGDSAAFSALYHRYIQRIYNYAYRRLNDQSAAEDVTQVVFIRVATSLDACRDGAAFAGWLFAIARNAVSDAQRTQMRAAAPLDDDLSIEDTGPSPEDYALAAERSAELRAARERCLNQRERELFDLLLADLNDKEIAMTLGRRHGAIRTAHWRLLAKLRHCLGLITDREGARHAPA